ncbi:MAG TPA: hypothetical protein VG106_14225, partial [Vicinamibacterales bacterium]|nr:hypothetical protein [Vicinamibacterales bacterium]
MTSLQQPPSPLTQWQRRLLWITFLFVAVTRIYAMADTLWDWDEVQFSAGVREFNVGHPFHHPHPPGFPLYMLAAKIARLAVPDDFRACQTVTILAACALFPLAFFLARELRFPFLTSYLGALLFVFFPNIWFYGGTAFSDIAGIATSLAAALLLFRGCWSERAYLGGAVLLGVAAGIRPQAVLLGAAPFLVASYVQLRRSWTRVAIGCAIVAAMVIASYAGAALSSRSIEAYRAELGLVRAWVRSVDSFLSPQRPPLLTLADEFLLRPMGGNRLPIVVCTLAVVGMLRRRMSVGLALATLFPFALFAWLMLDYHSVHRYSTAYVLLWALLAAHGASALADVGAGFSPSIGRLKSAATSVLLALIIGRAAYWTLPALREVRGSDSPTFAAMQWIRANVPPRQPVWVHMSLEPFSEYFLYDRDVRLVKSLTELPRVGVGARDFFATEGLLPAATFVSRRERRRLWEIARHRYFETSVVPVSNVWGFGDGWYSEESDGGIVWQWMGAKSEALLPVMNARARLMLTLTAAPNITPTVEVRLNGATVDRFTTGGTPVQREWIVTPRHDGPNRLELTSSVTTRV